MFNWTQLGLYFNRITSGVELFLGVLVCSGGLFMATWTYLSREVCMVFGDCVLFCLIFFGFFIYLYYAPQKERAVFLYTR